MTLKRFMSVENKFENKQIVSHVKFTDGSQIYIFIQRDMIFVADCDYEELCHRIDAGDVDSFESYDTIDGCAYYHDSEYAVYISEAFIWYTHTCGNF